MSALFARAAATTLAVALAVAIALPPLGAGAQSGAQTFRLRVHPGSARAAFRQALSSLRVLRDVRVRSAVADRADRFVEGSFTAIAGGRPVSGVLLAGNGVATGAYDTRERAAQTIPAFLASLTSSGGGGPADRPLHRVSFGSGTIALPLSWSVANAYQGCVEAASTQDHGYLAFGCSQAARAPPLLPGTNPRQVLVVNSADPVDALQRLMLSPSPAGIGASAVRVREVKPVQAVGNGRAAYVLFDYTVQSAPYTGLALVNVAATDTRQFIVYKSMFMLPASTFPRLAPALWKSWQSWGVNGNVLTGRLFAAAKSMRETGDIITGAYWDRVHAHDRAALGFDQYLRDAAQAEDLQTGERANGSWDALDRLATLHPERYRIVPLSELQP